MVDATMVWPATRRAPTRDIRGRVVHGTSHARALPETVLLTCSPSSGFIARRALELKRLLIHWQLKRYSQLYQKLLLPDYNGTLDLDHIVEVTRLTRRDLLGSIVSYHPDNPCIFHRETGLL